MSELSVSVFTHERFYSMTKNAWTYMSIESGRTGVRIGDISVSVLLGIGVVNLRSRRGA